MDQLALNQIEQIVSESSQLVDSVELTSVLLNLKPILDANCTQDPVISKIWIDELPQKILSVLKQDLPAVWLNTCNLCDIIVNCCLGCTLSGVPLHNDFFLDATYTILQILTKMTNCFIKADKDMKENSLGYISWVVKILSNLVEVNVTLSISVAASKHFMQFLMVEDSSISLVALSLLKNILKVNRNVFYHVSESRTHNIVDELAFKLFGNGDVNVAKISISVLLALIDIHPPLLQLFATKRYRGFKAYIIKWGGNGFDEEIKKLTAILESQFKFLHTSQIHENSAIIIQSFYRGYRLRSNLKKAVKGIARFQRLYRMKKHKEYEEQMKADLEKINLLHIESDRRKIFVDSKLKQLKTIEGIPAKTVYRFLENLENNSAKTIQAAWLGYRTRKLMSEFKPEMRKVKAAIKIQKQIRKWLERCREKRTDLADLLPAGLSDQRRVELQSLIVNVREKFPFKYEDDEQWKDLHDRSFRALSNHFMLLPQTRREDERRKALIAQLSVLSHQLENAPNLSDINEKHIDQYSSYSTHIATAARKEHIDSLNELKFPWWKKLGKGESSGMSFTTANTRFSIDDHEKLF